MPQLKFGAAEINCLGRRIREHSRPALFPRHLTSSCHRVEQRVMQGRIGSPGCSCWSVTHRMLPPSQSILAFLLDEERQDEAYVPAIAINFLH